VAAVERGAAEPQPADAGAHEQLVREADVGVRPQVATLHAAGYDLRAIRLGAGIRWAIMGPFLTYRIAGGEAACGTSSSSLGPALRVSWTELIDVPKLTPELIDRLAAPSDAPAAC
jgi:carnitine 3-dehydrogenase